MNIKAIDTTLRFQDESAYIQDERAVDAALLACTCAICLGKPRYRWSERLGCWVLALPWAKTDLHPQLLFPRLPSVPFIWGNDSYIAGFKIS